MDARITAVLFQIVACTTALVLLAGMAVVLFLGHAHGFAALIAALALFLVSVIYERAERVFELAAVSDHEKEVQP